MDVSGWYLTTCLEKYSSGFYAGATEQVAYGDKLILNACPILRIIK
jgi:hypothetical protein